MRNLVKRILGDLQSDEVRKKFVGDVAVKAFYAVLALIAVAGAYVWSVRNKITTPIYDWFSVPASLRRGEIAAALLVTFLAGTAAGQLLKRRRLDPINLGAPQPVAPPVPAVEVEPRPIPPDFVPTELQQNLMVTLFRNYPEEMDLREAHKSTKANFPGLSAAHIEHALEGLTAVGFIAARRVTDNACYYRMTTPGRNHALGVHA